MGRSNNGVPSKVTTNAQASVGGQMGQTRGNGGAPNQMAATPKEVDQSQGRGIYPPAFGSSTSYHGTTKDMGGVGSY